ncbi:MAG: DNA repair exonuclease [Candidatus Micrarchaeia archaeon]
MKLAVLSDFHLGYERFEEDALAQASEAFSMALESADLIIIAGDIFDSRTPGNEVLASAIRLFRKGAGKAGAKRVDGRGPPIVAIHGTHERRAKGLVNPVEILDAAGLLVNVHAGKAVFEKDGGRIAVHGLGGVPEDYARDAVGGGRFKPVEGCFNVFVFHQSLKELLPFSESFMSVEDLPEGFDLYINGHHHRAEVMEAHGKKLLLPGSTVVTRMKKEEAGKKGFYLFDTATGREEFVSIPARAFFCEEVEVKDAKIEEAAAAVRKAAERLAAKAPNPLVKIYVKGTLAKGLEPANLDFRSIEKSFEGRAYVEIESELASVSLSDRIALLRELRRKKLSVKEMGMEILKARLKEAGVPTKDAEEIFNLLATNPEAALKKFFGE